MDIELPSYDEFLTISKDYAEREIGTTMDVRRGRRQTDPDLVKWQTTVGKMGEYYVWYWLLKKGLLLDPPDIEVYTKGKSYSGDLTYNGMEIHVKTQTKKSADRFGMSWMFQLNKGIVLKLVLQRMNLYQF